MYRVAWYWRLRQTGELDALVFPWRWFIDILRSDDTTDRYSILIPTMAMKSGYFEALAELVHCIGPTVGSYARKALPTSHLLAPTATRSGYSEAIDALCETAIYSPTTRATEAALIAK